MSLITPIARHTRLWSPSLGHCRWNSSRALIQDSLKKYIRWYPHDSVTCSHIEAYFALNRNAARSEKLLVGVIRENGVSSSASKFLETLLSDPLSSGSDRWYTQLASRSTTHNNLFTYVDSQPPETLPAAFTRTLKHFAVPSPLLSAERRPQYPDVLAPSESVPNELQILEINNDKDIPKLVDVCAFYIYVCASPTSLADSLPKAVRKKILLSVIDNAEYTPHSTESTETSFSSKSDAPKHVIKINSQVLSEGIEDFYKNDAAAGGHYFESLQTSNILEVSKFLSWFLRSENLSRWMFNVIKTEIASNNISTERIQVIYEDLKLNTLVNGSSEMHSELQRELIPEATDFFNNKLRWWKLYFLNDNVEYSVKDFFNSHFMNKSIDSYNYLKGQLVARLQEQKYASYSKTDKAHLVNPLSDFKSSLINTRIPEEIQPVVYTLLVTAFLHYQLPLSVIAAVGYFWTGLQAQTAVAIASLGWVLGFNKVSKNWHEFKNTWLATLFEQVRVVISKQCMEKGLLRELNSKFEDAKNLSTIKQQVLRDLDSAENIPTESRNK